MLSLGIASTMAVIFGLQSFTRSRMEALICVFVKDSKFLGRQVAAQSKPSIMLASSSSYLGFEGEEEAGLGETLSGR